MTLGEFIRKSRKAKRLTLKQVAELSGTSKSYIWELENGVSINPGIMTSMQICRALEVSIVDFGYASLGEKP